MKFNSTYYELFKYNQELNDFALKHPAVAKMLMSGYRKFEHRNKVALNYLTEKLKALYEENVLKDERGQYEMNDERTDWKFKSTMHAQSFSADWQRLMETECNMVIGDEMEEVKQERNPAKQIPNTKFQKPTA